MSEERREYALAFTIIENRSLDVTRLRKKLEREKMRELFRKANEIENLPDKELKKTKFNLLDDFEGTIAAMGEIEGAGWAKHAQEDDSPNSAKIILSQLQEHNVGGTIYGSGGWHRWFIDSTGDIRFSLGHVSPSRTQEVIVKVKDLGFGFKR